jgi:hypothetical protein
MKTRIIILGAVVTAFAFTSFAAEPLLSPRAKDNQIKIVNSLVETPTITVAYVDSTSALLSPRAAGNEIKHVKGTNNNFNPALACRDGMGGTPKIVMACAEHTTMPGCAVLASRSYPGNWPETSQQTAIPGSVTVAPLKQPVRAR